MNKPNKNRRRDEREGAAHLGADKTRILNLGGGFAGVAAARYLDRTVAKRSDVEVTLSSRRGKQSLNRQRRGRRERRRLQPPDRNGQRRRGWRDLQRRDRADHGSREGLDI